MSYYVRWHHHEDISNRENGKYSFKLCFMRVEFEVSFETSQSRHSEYSWELSFTRSQWMMIHPTFVRSIYVVVRTNTGSVKRGTDVVECENRHQCGHPQVECADQFSLQFSTTLFIIAVWFELKCVLGLLFWVGGGRHSGNSTDWGFTSSQRLFICFFRSIPRTTLGEN